MYTPEIRVTERFFGRHFVPKIQENALAVKYYHCGVFFWVQAVYSPLPGSSDPVEVRHLIPRDCVVRLIDILRDQVIFKPYKFRLLFRDRQTKESAHRTFTDAKAARDTALSRHSLIGEYIIYRRSLDVHDVNVSGREQVLFFMRFNEPIEYSGDVLWEDYFSNSVAAHRELRKYEREKTGLGAVYGAVDYVCRKPQWSIPGWEA